MTELDKARDWARLFEISRLKLEALRACLRTDGLQMLEKVLKELKLKTAADVVRVCKSPTED